MEIAATPDPRGVRMELPDFVIIGAQKAGSTALMRSLGAHPQIHLPVKETVYFRDPWYQFQGVEELERGARTRKPAVTRRGIKSPDILGDPSCAGRVHQTLGPDTQLIAVLRDPVRRAISSYYWGMQWGWIPIEDPNVGIPRIMSGLYREAYPRASEVLEYGRYAAHLKRFIELFGRDQLAIVTDEELKADIDMQMRRIFEFLKVDPDRSVRIPTKRVNSGVYSMRRLQFLKRRHRYIYRPFEGFEAFGAHPHRPASMTGYLSDRAIAAWDRLVLARVLPNEPPRIERPVLNSLATYYRDDVRELSLILDKDLHHWLDRYE